MISFQSVRCAYPLWKLEWWWFTSGHHHDGHSVTVPGADVGGGVRAAEWDGGGQLAGVPGSLQWPHCHLQWVLQSRLQVIYGGNKTFGKYWLMLQVDVAQTRLCRGQISLLWTQWSSSWLEVPRPLLLSQERLIVLACKLGFSSSWGTKTGQRWKSWLIRPLQC